MVKKKIDVRSYSRVKLGKKENVRKHVRTIDPSPRVNKKTLKDIKTGKAKPLQETISESIGPVGIKPEELEKAIIGGYRKGGTKRIKVHIDEFDYVRKDGKKIYVCEHDRTVYIWIPPKESIFMIKKIRGEDRLVEVFTHKGKEYNRIVVDKRKQEAITQSEKVKEEWPWKKTMVKKMPDNLMKGFKEIGKDQYEHSIMLDFERHLKQPQRVAIVKGGKAQTPKFEDFELFGHTHPWEITPRPSTGDIRTQNPLEPEFIIAGGTGKMIFLNIENKDEYSKWIKKNFKKEGNTRPYELEDVKRVLRRKKYRADKEAQEFGLDKNYYKAYNRLLETKKGREIFFDITGVKVYPYKKNLTIELKDDPNLEKRMPNISRERLERYHKKSPKEERWQDWIKLESTDLKNHLNNLSASQIKFGSNKMLSSTEKRQKKEKMINSVVKKLNKLKTHYEMGPG